MSMIACFRRVPDDVLQNLLASPEQLPDFLEEEGFADLDIDKAWHALHFFLTGTAWEGEPPLDFLVKGGTEVGDVDMGYGPARGFTSQEVQLLWGALKPRTASTLRSAYNPERMRELEIYPDGWRSAAEDHLDDYFLFYFDELRQFIEGAVREREALLVWLS
ncbi:MAG TPA: YfbM family protein [Polyangiaceae bacterium]|jgi:hypothetical protein